MGPSGLGALLKCRSEQAPDGREKIQIVDPVGPPRFPDLTLPKLQEAAFCFDGCAHAWVRAHSLFIGILKYGGLFCISAQRCPLGS